MVVDASIWVSALLAGDQFHIISRAWLDQRFQYAEQLAIPSISLAEVAGAIARRTGNPALGRRSAAQILRAPNLRVVPIDAELGIESANLAADLRLRGADSIYVAAARRLNVPLVTLDLQMQARAGGVIRVLQPS